MITEQPTHEFFEEVQREHEELRVLLGNLHKVLSQRLEKVQRVSQLLASLVDHVENHFQEEEVAGFFDHVIERAPRLSGRIDDLRRDHQRMLAEVRHLYEVASEETGSSDWWQELEKAFHEFSTDLIHHETAENELLQQAYDEDIGTGD